MKKIVRNLVASLALVAALLIAADLQAKDAVLTKADGKVEMLSASGSWQKAPANKAVKAGTLLRTSEAAGSAAAFSLSDGSIVTLGSGTSLSLNKADSTVVSGAPVCDTVLNLKSGAISVNVPATAKAPKMLVQTPTKSVTIPAGSTAFVNAAGDVTVTKGTASVGNVSVGAAQTLKGEATTPAAATAAEQTSGNVLASYGSTPAPAASTAGAKGDAGDSQVQRGITGAITSPNMEPELPVDNKVADDVRPNNPGTVFYGIVFIDGGNEPAPVHPKPVTPYRIP